MKKDRLAIVISATIVVLAVTAIIIYRAKRGTVKEVIYPKDIKWAQNEKTLKMVNEMHPKLRQKFADFFTEVENKLGLYVVGTSGLRTSSQQQALSLENDNNASAGTSDHEYGFAMDINIFDKNGKQVLKKASSKKAWLDSGVVAIGKKYGFSWGGDFKNYHDPIHFYNDFGIPANDMAKLRLAGKVDKEGYLLV